MRYPTSACVVGAPWQLSTAATRSSRCICHRQRSSRSPFWRAILAFSQVNMVGVAKRPKAPDCGSGIRGFESHHPPQKRKSRPKRDGFFLFYGYLWVMGSQRAPLHNAGKSIGDTQQNFCLSHHPMPPLYKGEVPRRGGGDQNPLSQLR